MTDYLWDKTGKPEEDVERLEELLGQLRFQPRTFEVSATLPVVPRRAARTVNNISWPRLAVAASLLLTLLAGAWLVFTKQKATTAPNVVASGERAPRALTPPQQSTERAAQPENDNQLAAAPDRQDETSAPRGAKQRTVVEQASVRNFQRHPRVEFISDGQKRPAAPVRQSTARSENAPREQIAHSAQIDAATTLTPEEREAMSKFVLAMKVTSEKLSYAERQVQGMNESSPRR